VKFNFNIFKQALCTILMVQGMTMYSQVHIENAENVVVYDENNVHFFGKNSIKTESGNIEFSENIKAKLVKRAHLNKEIAEAKEPSKIDAKLPKLTAKNSQRKGSLLVAKVEKVNLSSNKLKLVTKYTQKQSKVSPHFLVVTSRFNIYESAENDYYSYGKNVVNKTPNNEIVPEVEQNQTPTIDFIEQNKPFLNLHNTNIEEIQLNPFKKNLKLENTLVVIYGKRGPPIFSLV
jgi:hypothetical protein